MKTKVVKAACYSFISAITAYLKMNYPAQFMAAALTMADENKKLELLGTVREMGISILPPDINRSKTDYTPEGKNTILYGLNAIKGVGETSIPTIIANKPYEGIEDAFEKLPKNILKKNVAEHLIKAGAFDFEDPNRNVIMNKFYDAKKRRKDSMKGIEYLNIEEYDRKTCMKYEDEVLGTHISYHNWWEEIDEDERCTLDLEIKSVKEHADRKGQMMAFVNFVYDDVEIEGLVFASKYRKLVNNFYKQEGSKLKINGKKSNGKLIVNDVIPIVKPSKLFTSAAAE